MLDRLEASGHIRRVFDPKDRRTVKIMLTETAKSMKSQYDEVSMSMNEIFYRDFSDKEILAFEKYLMRILKNLTTTGD